MYELYGQTVAFTLQILQTLYFGISTANDLCGSNVRPSHKGHRSRLQRWRDNLLATLVFPVGTVCMVISSTGRDQSSLCDTLLSVCPSIRLSVRKQFLLLHLLWGYLSQRLLYSPSLLALWCSCAPEIVIMILSPGAQKGGEAIFPI